MTGFIATTVERSNISSMDINVPFLMEMPFLMESVGGELGASD